MEIWQYCGLNLSGVGGVEVTVSMLHDHFSKLGHHVHTGLSRPPFSTEILLTHGDVYCKALPGGVSGRKWIHVFHGTTAARMLACREYLSPSGYRGLVRELTLAAGCDQAIAVAPHVKTEVRSYYWLKKPVSVIENGIDDSAFTALDKLTKSPVFAFVGRATDRVKNFSAVLQAFDGVYATNTEVKLLAIPGSSEQRSYLTNIGPVASKALREHLRQCRGLVLFSFYEGDPLVVREAMALGLPIVGSNIPGIWECARGYKNLILVEPNNVKALEDAIRNNIAATNLLPTPSRRPWEAVAREYIDLFQAAVQASSVSKNA